MNDVSPIDELREIRRKLAEECGCDVRRYAALLREAAERIPGPRATPETVAVPGHPSALRDAKRAG